MFILNNMPLNCLVGNEEKFALELLKVTCAKGIHVERSVSSMHLCVIPRLISNIMLMFGLIQFISPCM